MNQKKLSQSFKRLREAQTPDEIVQYLIECVYYQENKTGEPPSSTLEQIQAFTQPHALPPNTVVIAAGDHYECYTIREGKSLEEIVKERERPLLEASFSLLNEILSKGAPCTIQDSQISIEAPAVNSEIGKRYLQSLEAAIKALATPQGGGDFNHFATYLLMTAGEPTPARLLWLNKAWAIALEDNPDLKHPSAPLARAWLTEQIAPPRPREYDRTHPGAVMAQKSVSTVRYPLFETIAEARKSPLEAPRAAQLLLPTLERKLYLPDYLPIQIVQGVDMKGRDGVLPYAMRFFFEVGMSLKPTQRTGYYCRTLYDAAVDIGIIDPNSKQRNKRSLRTKDKEAIQNAIELLNEIRLPYREPVGGIGLWLPFRPLNIPTRLSEKDFPIRVWVQLPLDDKRGVLVVREIVRSLYQKLPQLNAYLAAYTLFNQHGLSPQNALIDPTEPDPNTPRLETGQLAHPKTGEPLFDKRGKPQ